MEDSNPPSDDEIQDLPLSPQSGGKKLKLNDGSSQDSICNDAGSSSKDVKENVDSGVSADKSESTSSEDHGGSTSLDPINGFVSVTASNSNVRAFLLDIRRERYCRTYRKRKTSDSESTSSSDSDGLSVDQLIRVADRTTNSVSTTSVESISDTSSSSRDSMMNIDSDDEGNSSEEADSSDEADSEDATLDNNSEQIGTPPVLSKTQPRHNYVILREIINREMGLTFPAGKTIKEDVIFERKFYGSLHAVYRMAKYNSLVKHKGCVNSINFHPEGHRLASGSDDLNVIVWDWSRNIPLQNLKTGHKTNVFQSKFLHLNSQTQLNIVTCARDGQVRLLQCPSSSTGASCSRRRLATHSRAAHKVHVSPADPHIVISAGEDAVVIRSDVREERGQKLFRVVDELPIPLYSITGHPINSHELLVAGRNKFLRVYDQRKPTTPLHMYCARFPLKGIGSPKMVSHMMHLTSAVYSHDGSEILGSYNDEDIYLFDARTDVYEKHSMGDKCGYSHKYSGHRNSATYKGVSFFGANSEYVVSGSDCSHIFIWEKHSEAIVQWVKGDTSGVVNCIEAHPRFPVLATSGLDNDIKIWMPRKQWDPTFEGLEKVVRANSIPSREPRAMFNDFLPSLYNAWQGALGNEAPVYGGTIDFDGNACTTF
ncbi:DDB1- and CUL4-associated factor 8 [Leptidea sinapis]|uniref:DDB1- and CUL4-associated factor 8 n=1 Tax=Leptidea sinapis TaxID=189913 RepID=UPI0021206F6B|nr:DDB1- and CUL4-associated factor 8 [Leptidea sinapis]